MSKINYVGGHWTPDRVLFTSHRQAQGPLATRHGQNMGGTSAYVLLGPDICMPGGQTNNPPTATGPGWDAAWGNAGAGGPGIYFTQDANFAWIRAHMVNAEWAGSGANWNNLVPMTSGGNANHKTIEARMKVYLQNFRAFDRSNGGHKTYWYGLQYWVQASTDPWAMAPALMGNLYSYAPNMIKVTWQIVQLNKPPVGHWGTAAQAIAGTPTWINNVAPLAAPANLALDCPNLPGNNLPAVLPNNPANMLALGGGVCPVPPGAPAVPVVPANPLDGTVEIMQI